MKWLACAALLVLTACGGSTIAVPASEGSARVPAGSTLQIDFGRTNGSVGDSWHLVGKPDRTMLKDLGYDFEPDSDADGSSGVATWRFEALSAGRTTVRLQYCFRSSPPDCKGNDKPAPKPVEIAVTVE